jgi:bifunctional non-homologous end joining protein LigD
VRHVRGTTFYHRGPLSPIPRSVHQLKVAKREGGEGTRLWVDDLDGLLGLVEIGAIELHPWNATVDHIELADVLVFDCDPGTGINYDFVIALALAMRELLRAEGFMSWPKLTGGKGIHVMAPLKQRIKHDEAHALTKHLAQRLAATAPKHYTLSASLANRAGRLFIDYLRNGRGTTAVGAYSPRARPDFRSLRRWAGWTSRGTLRQKLHASGALPDETFGSLGSEILISVNAGSSNRLMPVE